MRFPPPFDLNLFQHSYIYASTFQMGRVIVFRSGDGVENVANAVASRPSSVLIPGVKPVAMFGLIAFYCVLVRHKTLTFLDNTDTL